MTLSATRSKARDRFGKCYGKKYTRVNFSSNLKLSSTSVGLAGLHFPMSESMPWASLSTKNHSAMPARWQCWLLTHPHMMASLLNSCNFLGRKIIIGGSNHRVSCTGAGTRDLPGGILISNSSCFTLPRGTVTAGRKYVWHTNRNCLSAASAFSGIAQTATTRKVAAANVWRRL